MALETLKGVRKIDGFDVVDLEKLKADHTDDNGNIDWDGIDANREDYPISIAFDKNMLSFKLQNGPVKEVGVNGCQVDTIIETAIIIIDGLNKKFYCKENAQALSHLKMALGALHMRKKDREKRGVEGRSEA